MQVNICPRLIEKNIKKGVKYFDSTNVKYSQVIPRGVFATQSYQCGAVLRIMTGYLYDAPTKESIHIGNNMHVVDLLGKYINHSFQPNVKIENNLIIAIKDIDIYDEITFNYNDSEMEMAEPFEDEGIKVCGSSKSRIPNF